MITISQISIIKIISLIITIAFLASCNQSSDNNNNNNNIEINNFECKIPDEPTTNFPILLENPKLLNTNPVVRPGGTISSLEISKYGYGLIIWREIEDSQISLYSNSIYILENEQSSVPLWGDKIRINNNLLGDVTSPSLSMNDCGEAIVTWNQNNQSLYKFYDQEYGWGIEQVIDDNQACHSLSLNNNGTGFCIYAEGAGGNTSVYSRRFTKEGGWENPIRIDSPSEGGAQNVTIKVDVHGNATGIWDQYTADQSGRNIWSNTFKIDSGWQTPQRIENRNEGHSYLPKFDIDQEGNSLVIWIQYDGPVHLLNSTKTSVFFNNYTIENGWNNEFRISSNEQLNSNNAAISVNKIGQGVVAWNLSSDNNSPPTVHVVQFDENMSFYETINVSIGQEWESSNILSYLNNTPDISINDNMDINVVWSAPSPDSELFINHYDSNSGWREAKLMESVSFDAFSPKVKTDNSGDAIVIWNQHLSGSTDYNIYGAIEIK